MNNYLTVLLFILISCFVCKAQENRPGQPIGGIIVKGGKSPINQPQNQSIINTSKSNTKDKVVTDEEITNSPKTNPMGQPQNQSIVNTTKSNTKDKVITVAEGIDDTIVSPVPSSTYSARPGEPIGGIVVKGGRNPGGQMKMITNNKGEFTFQNLKTADLQFIIELPEAASGNSDNARPGEPIGGIIVKGGKNHGGQLFTLMSDEHGVITLKDLPAGDYKFKITAPTKAENSLYKTN